MKDKIMRRILVFATAVSLVCSIGATVYADDQPSSDAAQAYDGQIVPEDPVDLFIEDLDENLQAGAYLDDNGDLVLAVTDLEAAQKLINEANLPEEIKLVEVEYSLAELKAARDDLFEKAEEYDIQIVALDASVNGLAVFTTDTTDSNKDNVSNHVTEYAASTNEGKSSRSAGIKVLIYDNKGTPTPELDESAIEPDKSERAASVKSGVYLSHQPSSGYESTVGWRISVNGVSGYTTCGHNWANGTNAYYQGTLLGKVTNIFNNVTDISFIPSNVPFYGMRGDGKKISGAGAPVLNSKVIFDGARHYQENEGRQEAKIIATIGKARIIDNFGREGRLSNLIVFNKQPWFGDSGCAIIEDRGNGTVRLVGFNSCQYKADGDGPDEWNHGAAVTWTSVRDALGGKSVVQPMN